MAAHTPGPWKTGKRPYKTTVTYIETVQGRLVATALSVDDARLIAEAPALLALIRQGLDLDKNEERQCPCVLCEASRAIVARVEGQG